MDNSVTIKSENKDVAIVAGYGVVFGGKDLEGETFMPETEFMLDLVPEKPVLYDHRQAEVKHFIGHAMDVTKDSMGLWLEAQIDKSKEYAEAVLELVRKGRLGWSSGSVAHMVEKVSGLIKQWPIVEFSLTPTPAEPRTLGVEQIKSVFSVAGLDVPSGIAEGEKPVEDEGQGGGDEQIQIERKILWQRTGSLPKKSKRSLPKR